jgi:hypothetical protein
VLESGSGRRRHLGFFWACESDKSLNVVVTGFLGKFFNGTDSINFISKDFKNKILLGPRVL